MLDQLVELLEGAFVEEAFHPLPGRELAFRVLPLAALPAAAFLGTPDLVVQGV